MRMCRYLMILATAIVVIALTSRTRAQVPCVKQQKITVSGTSFNFGSRGVVFVSGDKAVVGVTTSDRVADIFGFNGTSWTQDQELVISNVSPHDYPAGAVSLSKNTVVVAVNSAVYVFRFNGNSWVEEQKLTASDSAQFAGFGVSVSVSGNTVLVGASRDDCVGGLSSDCGSVYVYHFNGTSWVEQPKLFAADAKANDHFGVAVSVDGDTAIVGAVHVDYEAGIYHGSAYVFHFDGNSWVEQQKLTSPNPTSTDIFGETVSVSGDTAVVGSSQDDCAAGIRCGAAYVFRYNGVSWNKEQKLVASDLDRFDRFGESVSVSNDKVVVGAPRNYDPVSSSSGAAYVYQYNGSRWVELSKLVASDTEKSGKFGDSVSISGEFVSVSGTTIVTGAQSGTCDQSSPCASVFMFDFMPGETCQICDVTGQPDDVDKDCNGNGQADTCDISNGVSNDCDDNGIPDECDVIPRGQFVLSDSPLVSSLFGDLMAVGASKDNEKRSNAGAVYIFRTTHAGWGFEKKLFAHDGASGDGFGSSISAGWYTVLVGAPGDDERGPSSGAAYIFGTDGKVWSEQAKLTIPDGEVGKEFGTAVAYQSDLVIISTKTLNSDSHGAVYVYRFDGTSWTFESKLVADDENSLSMFGASIAATRDTIVVGAPDSRPSKRGAVYVFRYRNGQWTKQAKLSGDAGLSRGNFGQSVAINDDIIVVGYPTEDLLGIDRTAAFVYRLNWNEWLLESKILASDSTLATNLGRSMALDGSRILLSAQLGAGLDSAGGVIVFHRNGIRWVQESVLILPMEHARASFGSTVAIGNDNAFVGSSVISKGQSTATLLSYGLGGPDCNQNGLLDSCDVTASTSQDCTGNGFLDECEADCNDNGVADSCDILERIELDCNDNGVPDSCDLLVEFEKDCNGNTQPDSCDISSGESADCNDNAVPDECEVIARGQFELNKFPTELSMDGDVVAICSKAEDRHGLMRNAVLVFKSTPAGWGLDGTIFAPEENIAERFCSSISVHENHILVGASGEGDSGPSAGSAYIFERNNSSWLPRAKFTIPEREVGKNFGEVVALTEKLAVVSSLDHRNITTSAVFIFRVDESKWNFEAKLINPNVTQYLQFGESLAVDGDTIVVGAPDFRSSGGASAYIYRYEDGQWNQQARLQGENKRQHRFGLTVAISDGVIVIGNPTGPTVGDFRGGGFVYRFKENEWKLEAKLRSRPSAMISLHGLSMAMDGERILLGGMMGHYQETQGVVTVYRRRGKKWVEERILFSPAENPTFTFGNSIAVSGQTAFLSSSIEFQDQTIPVLLSLGLSGPDCNENGVLDSCDVTAGTSQDCTSNGFLDECEADCNDNDVADSCDIEDAFSQDCNSNRIPDECDIARHDNADCNHNNVPDECEPDIDGDGFVDDCDKCPDSDTSKTVVVNACDSMVANHFLGHGCNMMDKLRKCREEAKRHGSYENCVAKKVRRWRKHEKLTKKEARRIKRCVKQDNEDDHHRDNDKER